MNAQETFGETVRRLREAKKLTLREVATELGVDTSMLGKIEKNNRKPTKQLIEKIAQYFKVSPKELTIIFLSDKIAYQILDEEDIAQEILRIAEDKVKYLAKGKTANQ